MVIPIEPERRFSTESINSANGSSVIQSTNHPHNCCVRRSEKNFSNNSDQEQATNQNNFEANSRQHAIEASRETNRSIQENNLESRYDEKSFSFDEEFSQDNIDREIDEMSEFFNQNNFFKFIKNV